MITDPGTVSYAGKLGVGEEDILIPSTSSSSWSFSALSALTLGNLVLLPIFKCNLPI